MINSWDGYCGAIKSADALARQILPVQLDLLQLFFPMDYWIVGRQNGKQFDVVATHGDAGGWTLACLLDALAHTHEPLHTQQGLVHQPVGATACQTSAANEFSLGAAPRYVFRAQLSDRQGNLAGTVAGFLFHSAAAAPFPFSAPVVMLCLNTMAHALSLQADLAQADRRMLKVRQSARIDPLTGVLNHAGWRHAVNSARGIEGEVAIGFIDLDQFKRVNDTHGHQAGDEILKLTARLIRTALRANDCVARLGGDEFAVLLPGISLIDARQLGERLCHILRQGGIVVSIGVAAKSEVGSLQKTQALADERMYEHKRRNCCAAAVDIHTTRRFGPY